MIDQPSPRRRFQFRLRTLMILVTVFCFVIGGYTGWQKKIVKERRAWLHVHSRQPESLMHEVSILGIGDVEQGPGLIRCWLGDEPQEYLKLENPAPEETEVAHQLFPEANFTKFQSITQTSGH